MEFTVDMFLRQRWNDPRLAFGRRLNNTASNIDTLRDNRGSRTETINQKVIKFAGQPSFAAISFFCLKQLNFEIFNLIFNYFVSLSGSRVRLKNNSKVEHVELIWGAEYLML